MNPLGSTPDPNPLMTLFSLRKAIVATLISVGLIVLGQSVFAASGTNRSLNYQANLLTSSGTSVPDGTYQLKFSLYSQVSGGTPIWTASGTNSVPTPINVTVTNGLFSVLLGDTSFEGQNPFNFDWYNDSLYLGVTVDADSEMSPRKRLSSVPYAFVAETLQGQYASSSVTSTGGNLFSLNQTANDSASATRTALSINTQGTSNLNDYLLTASNSGGNVFTISRQGNVTTTGNIAINGNSTLGDSSSDILTVNSRIASDLVPSSDLVRSLGSSSLRWNAELGRVSSTNVYVSSALSIGTSTQSNALTVVGNVGNVLENTDDFELVGTVGLTNDSIYFGDIQNGFYYYPDPAGQLIVVDVRDVTNSEVIGLVDIGDATASPVQVVAHGAYVFMTRRSPNAFFTIDVSNPVSPRVVATTTLSDDGDPFGMMVVGKYLYTSSDSNGFYVFDISNPVAPVEISRIDAGTGFMVYRDGFIFVTDVPNGQIHAIDARRPDAPVLIASVQIDANIESAIAQHGRYVYVIPTSNQISLLTIDTVDPYNPVVVATTTYDYGFSTIHGSEGRYLYAQDGGGQIGFFDAGASSTSPVYIGSVSTTYVGYPIVEGPYLYSFPYLGSTGGIFRIPGIETASLLAASAELGNLEVQTNASIANQLSVGGSLNIGMGGFYSAGAFAISSTNTTSTILFSVSTTNAEVSRRLTVGGVNVCLANGTNCPASSSGDTNWTFSAANGGFIYPATSTNDVVLGATASATAPFYFDAQTVTSSLQIGRNGNANLLVGTSTYGGGLNSAFTLNGNDLFTQGMIGSIEGIYSATGVQVGTGTTVYGDGNLYKTNNGDFRMALNVASSSWRFYTAGNERLTVASSGNIGIGVSNPSEALDVAGNVENIYTSGQTIEVIGDVTISGGAQPFGVALSGTYGYVSDYGLDRVHVVDLSDPMDPRTVTSVTAGTDPWGVAVQSGYLYVVSTASNQLRIFNISNPASPILMSTLTTGSFPHQIEVQGGYVYISAYNADQVQIIDVNDPSAPRIVRSISVANPLGINVQGRYLYVSQFDALSFSVIDAADPETAQVVGSMWLPNGSGDIAVHGRYAYVASYASNVLNTVDILDPSNPQIVATTTLTNIHQLAISGRYLYVSRFGPTATGLAVYDLANPTSPTLVLSQSAGDDGYDMKIRGRYLYYVSQGTDEILVLDVGGIETSSLLSASAEFGNFHVHTNASIANQLTVVGSLNIGAGGFYSAGAFAISSTNTTSTVLYAVSTTNMEVSRRLTVGGVNVCLSSGINCPSTSGDSWTFSATNGGFIYPATSTNDVVLGATASATAPFYFDAQTVTSSLQIGRNANANLLVGTSTYGGGLNSAFTVNGNDLFTQGMIGSIEGIYSATGVQVGTGTTVYGDGNLYKTNNGDFRMALNVASSSWRFYTAGTERLTFASSGNIGIGVSNPSEALDVVGSIENIISPGSSLTQVSTTTFNNGANSHGVFVAASYAYVANYANHTLGIVDISNSTSPRQIATTTFANGSGPTAVFVSGRYAYVTNLDNDTMATVDISNPASPVQIATTTFASGADPISVYVAGKYAYVTAFSSTANDALVTVDISNPISPVIVNTLAFANSVDPISVYVSGRYAYVANEENDTMSILDLVNPAAPVQVATTTFNAGTDPYEVVVSGRYAYVALYGSKALAVVDILNPTAPVQVATTTVAGGPDSIAVSGRYVYTSNFDNDTMTAIDISVPSAPVVVATSTLVSTANPRRITVFGQNVFMVSRGNATLSIFKIPGIETSSLLAHSAELGSLSVRTSASIANQLTVGGSLNIGSGGFYSAGAFAISSTNTTSTILFSVSTTNAEVSNRLTVGGVSVCLANGTNCSSSSGDSSWTFSAANGGFIYPATSTNDVVLGATASATAPFYFDAQTVTSSLQIGRNGNANLLVGTTTYGGGLNSAFTVNGNDLFTQGMIGSIEGIYSATGVQVGTGTTVYGDGNLYKTNNGDFRMALNVASSSWRFYTAGNERLTVASSGNIGIGTANPTEALDVVGNVENVISSSAPPVQVATTTFASGVGPVTAKVSGNYAYVVNYGNDTMATVDITNPLRPVQVATTTFAGGSNPFDVFVTGKYAYVTLHDDPSMVVIDISNPTAPVQVGVIEWGDQFESAHPTEVYVEGRYAYVAHFFNPAFAVVDISNPVAPVQVATTTFTSSARPRSLEIQGRYAYVANNNNDTMNIVDIANPLRPVTVATTTYSAGAGVQGVSVQGRYAYVSLYTTGQFSVVDISNPNSPRGVATTTFNSGSQPANVSVSGRYAYVALIGGNAVATVDVSNPLAPVQVATTTFPTSSNLRDVTVSGQHLYVAAFGANLIATLRIPGVETSSLLAGSAELGSLNVRNNVSIANQLTVGGSLNIGMGGFYSAGAFAISSTNTTSTILFSVSTTNAEISNRLTVGGVRVCLENGANCPASSPSEFNWTYSQASGFIRPTTSTNDVVLGASASATAPFYFDAQTVTSSLQIGRNGNSNLFVGTSTYSDGLNSAFSVNGNDIFVQGMIGSIEGIYSATGVQVGTGTAVYGDGNLYKTNNGDFTFALNDSGSSYRLYTSSTERFTIASNGNVGIGVSNPTEELEVAGMIDNSATVSSSLTFVRTVPVGTTPITMLVQGDFGYAISQDDRFRVFDLSEPSNPRQIASIASAADPSEIAIQGRYAYITGNTADNIQVIDISNPGAPAVMSSLSIGNDPRGIGAYGKYLYVLNYVADQVQIVDVSLPTAPRIVRTLSMDGPRFIRFSGKYAYVSLNVPGTVNILDVSNPEAAYLVGSVTSLGTNLGDIMLAGRYAYVSSLDNSRLNVLDISNPTAPTLVKSVTTTAPYHMHLQGRYLYTSNYDAATISMFDVASATNPILVDQATTAAGSRDLTSKGQYLYVITEAGNMYVFDTGGTQLTSAVAAAANLGGVRVRTEMSLANQLRVEASMSVGPGGIHTLGALAVNSTNTTSTFAYAVSSTFMEVSNRLRVNRQSVCLMSGLNCLAAVNTELSIQWSSSTANGTLFLTTTTRDLLVGGSTTATAGFIVDTGGATGSVMFGANSNTSAVVGTSTYRTGLDRFFRLTGNDLFVQGFLGSLGGFFSTTGVRVGAASSTIYTDSLLYSPAQRDFQLSVNDSGSSFRFFTSSTERLTVATSGRVGIGISAPQTELDVNGDVSARMTTSTDLRLVNSFSQPGTPENFVIHGNFVYLVGSSPNRLYVLDITDPANPQSVTTTQIGSAGVDLKVRGNFLYILSSGNIMSYDISNPRSPRFRGSASINLGGAVRFEIYEHYLYIAQDNGALNVYNIQFPDVPVFVGTQTAWSSNGLAVKGRYLFSATSFDNTFKVFDLSNPERPTQIATTTDVGTQPRDMIVMGNYAYVTALTSNILTTVDISNPWAPRAVASTTIATQNSRNHLYGSGNLIYIASNSGLTVVDVSNPTAPRRKVNMTLTNPRRVVASGRYVYTAQSANLFHTYEIQGLETNALVAATAQFGEFSVLGNGELVPNLSADGITMGVGGAFIQGELSVGSATSVLGDILPGIPGASDLGSPTLSWRNITASGTLMAASAELSSLLVTPSSTSISVLSSTSSDVGNLAAVIQGKYLYSVKDGSGSADSLQIWDVSDSRNLRLLSEFGISQFGGSLPIDLKIKGKYAYVLASNGFTPRMTIVDISNPSQPVTSTSLSIGIGGVELATYGGYVYATMRDTDFSDGFDIVDVRNPARPQRKSVAVNPTGLAQVEIHDGYMLALGGSVNTRDLFIYSLADPENPVLASSTRFATSAVQDIDVQGRYAYIGANGSSNVSWRVVDWTDPSVPVVATSVKMSLDPSITEVKVAGEYLYLGGSGGQIFVYDISDPYNPVQVASHQMASLNQVREIEVQGGVMYILQSQSASGGSISIATLGLTELATIDAASAELGSLSVLTNASVQGQFTVSGDLSVGSGGILSQGLLGVFTSSTFATTTVISNSASNTNAVLEVLGGCDNGNVTGTSRLVSVGNMTDTRKFMVTCGGNVYADGTFSSPATDFAEYFSSDGSLTVGDVLVLDPNGTPSNPSVLKSSSSASSRARTLGVFSTKPSFVGGYTEGIESGASSTHVPVALLGRVPTKASAINGAILPGDQLMVSSNGTAVKAKGPGMILGIAIEALPSGTDTIEVFVDPTYWGGDLLNNDIVIASSTEASASLFTVNSPSLSLQGSAWNGSSANTISFSLTTQVLSTTSSNFVLSNTSGTSLLTISNLGNTNISGDLTVGRKLYLGSKTNQAGSASTYIFVDDTLSPTSTYIATNADGWSTSSTFDYAERFPSPENLIPGELVMADQNNTENVIKTNNQNNIVLGIVSTKPGFVTGAPNPGTYPIALAGRVPTKIIGQINIGDEVRASNIPGIAEKAEGPGPIIGIALQAHTSPEQGTIIVFVKPGWSLGNVSSLNSNTTNNSYSTTNISSEGSTKRGLAKIYVGSTEVQVTFASIQAYPVVQARPLNRPNAGYWITNVSDTGFKITLDQPAQTDVTFTWSVDPSPVGAEMWFSDETNAVYDPLTGQVVGPTPQPPEETASSTGDVSP